MKQGIPDRVGTYTAAGTSWMYKRPLLTNDGESIMAEGPTNEDVEVMVSPLPCIDLFKNPLNL